MKYMKYVSQSGDEEITTLRVKRVVRRKLGLLIDGNEKLAHGLERLLDIHIEELPSKN